MFTFNECNVDLYISNKTNYLDLLLKSLKIKSNPMLLSSKCRNIFKPLVNSRLFAVIPLYNIYIVSR